MTGYGEAERETSAGRLRVEIKTVNHRYLNTQIRTPTALERFDRSIRGWIEEFLSRGHVNLSLRLETDGEGDDALLPQLDRERARRYRALVEELREELDLSGEVGVAEILRFRDIFVEPDPETAAPEVDEEELRELIHDASRAVVRMREVEGRRLQEDFEERVSSLGELLDRVEERAPERLTAERERLRGRIAELVDSDDVDDERLEREIVYLAEKWDISEEVVRFRSHLDHFRELLGAPGSEPAGKRLSFVVQEMHREANTIGAKANDAEISQAVVGTKEEIERLREQVENVE